MNRNLFTRTLIAGALVWPYAQSAVANENVMLVAPAQMRNDVSVQINQAANGKIAGIVTNNTGHRISNPELSVRYDWIWENEYQPGSDNPGWAATYVLPQELGANESVSFTLDADRSLPQRADGHFQQSVGVTGYTQFK